MDKELKEQLLKTLILQGSEENQIHFLKSCLNDYMTEQLLDLYNNENYNACKFHAKNWEETEGEYYQSILCCKEIISGGKNNKKSVDASFDKIKKWVSNDIQDIYAHILDDVCVLCKGHTGRCHNTADIFKVPKSTIDKVKTAIYSTPGNDDFIFKNRSNRLFPIMLTDSFQRKIKNKNEKLSCAIPIKDASTPLMQAGAYLDYITFLLNIQEVREKHTKPGNIDYLNLMDNHKKELIKRFKANGKTIFNKDGFTICPVTGYTITLNDVSGDTRIDNNKYDIQLGHCENRNENLFTIRGFNICMMTREGNRLVGDSSFFDNSWLDTLKTVLKFNIKI